MARSVLHLPVGYACNNRCVFCPLDCPRGERVIPRERLLKRLEVGRLSHDRVTFSGGEPTLNRHLIPLISAARRLGYTEVTLETNGRRLAERRVVSALVRAGVSHLQISIHGPECRVHDSLTRRPGSYVESLAGLRNALDSGVRTTSSTVLLRHNRDSLEELIELLSALGVAEVFVTWMRPAGRAGRLPDDELARLGDLPRALVRASERARALGVFLTVQGIPMCVMRGQFGLLPLSDTWTTPPTSRSARAHGAPCGDCAAREMCAGVWSEYAARFGCGELRPFAV